MSCVHNRMRRFYREHIKYLHIKENRKDNPIMPPELELWLTLMTSNYPCLEHIFMAPKVFEPLNFYCTLKHVSKTITIGAFYRKMVYFQGKYFVFMFVSLLNGNRFLKERTFPPRNIFSCKNTPAFVRTTSARKAKRKSQKLFPFLKMLEKICTRI